MLQIFFYLLLDFNKLILLVVLEYGLHEFVCILRCLIKCYTKRNIVKTITNH